MGFSPWSWLWETMGFSMELAMGNRDFLCQNLVVITGEIFTPWSPGISRLWGEPSVGSNGDGMGAMKQRD